MNIKYHVTQSIYYPYWWRNIGAGWPRTIVKNLLWKVGGGGFFSKRKNPIYTLYWWSHDEYLANKTAIILNKDGSQDVLNTLGMRVPFKVPLYKKPVIMVFDLFIKR